MSKPEPEVKAVLDDFKAKVAKLDADAKSDLGHVKSLWARYEIYVIAIAASIVTLIVAHLLHL